MESGKVLDNNCPLCGASIKFNPKLGKFRCEFCRGEFTLEELKKHIDNAAVDKVNDGQKAMIHSMKNINAVTVELK